MSRSRPIQVVAIASGKGGVGKTQLAINLSMALADMQRRVVLMDANLALGSVDIALGLSPQHTIGDVIAGTATLADVVIDGPAGIRIVPASSGNPHTTALNAHQYAALIHGFNELGDGLDVLVVDTGPGVSERVVNFICASREAILVVCDEPTSIANAHALIQILNAERNLFRFRVVCNRTRNAQESRTLFAKLNDLCESSLDVALHYLGHVPFDDNIASAAQKQKALLELAPRSRAAQAIRVLAQKVDELPPPAIAGGRLEFFVEDLVRNRD